MLVCKIWRGTVVDDSHFNIFLRLVRWQSCINGSTSTNAAVICCIESTGAGVRAIIICITWIIICGIIRACVTIVVWSCNINTNVRLFKLKHKSSGHGARLEWRVSHSKPCSFITVPVLTVHTNRAICCCMAMGCGLSEYIWSSWGISDRVYEWGISSTARIGQWDSVLSASILDCDVEFIIDYSFWLDWICVLCLPSCLISHWPQIRSVVNGVYGYDSRWVCCVNGADEGEVSYARSQAIIGDPAIGRVVIELKSACYCAEGRRIFCCLCIS